MHNRVIGNLNSEQLFWAWSENPKLKHLGLQISVTLYTIPFQPRKDSQVHFLFLLQNGAQERHPTEENNDPIITKTFSYT